MLVSVYFAIALCNVVVAFAAKDIFDAIASSDLSAIDKILSDSKDQLNKKGPGGQTPLMNAVLSGKTSAVASLLKYGADVTIPEQDGYTPMHGAGFQGRANIAKLLIDHGIPTLDAHSDGYIPMHRACWGTEDRHTETVKVFLEAGVPVRYKAENGKTCWQVTKNKETKKLLKTYTAKLPPKSQDDL